MKFRKSLVIIVVGLVGFYSCVPTREIRDENTSVPENYQNHSTDTVNSGLVQ